MCLVMVPLSIDVVVVEGTWGVPISDKADNLSMISFNWVFNWFASLLIEVELVGVGFCVLLVVEMVLNVLLCFGDA